MQSLRKSFKRKKRDQAVQNASANNNENNENVERKMPRLDPAPSDENINQAKAPICQVKMSSSENLRTEESDANSKLSLSSAEVLQWLTKPIESQKFFR